MRENEKRKKEEWDETRRGRRKNEIKQEEEDIENERKRKAEG